MSLNKIKKEISNNLTGDASKDKKYLLEASEKYKDDPNAKQILIFIGKELFKVSNQKEKEAAYQITEKEDIGTQAILSEIEYYINDNNYKSASGLINVCIGLIEKKKEYENSETTEYHCFNEAAEEIIYRFVSQSNKEFIQIDQDYSKAYYLFGLVLLQENKIKEACNAFESSLVYNPMNMKTNFELLKLKKDSDFINYFNKLSELVFKKEDVISLYNIAIDYYKNKDMNYEKYQNYLDCFLNNKEIIRDKDDELLELPNSNILGILYTMGNKYQENKQKDLAKYYFKYLYELTNDEEIKSIITKLK